jgi:1-deoxy-D-xylulose-5-phosphate synthase
MSIAQNVGALSRYLGKLLASPRYNRWKRSVETVGTRLRMHPLRSAYFRIEEAVKSIFLRSVMFEEFGLRYVGPIDGHSIPALLDALSIAREASQPILLHISTQKGRGYPFAEQFPEKWHGTAGFDIKSGEAVAAEEGPTYSASFGAALEDLASRDERIVAITAAMRSGTGLARFAERFPRRFFDVGISEEHAVVFAAGLAAQGLRPVVAMYSTFSQRVVDCMIHDVCLQNLPVLLCLDRAGVVGDDGPTHHGVFDIALLRPVPRLVIMQPKDEAELAHMLYTAIRMDGPAVIRYPRGVGSGARRAAEYESLPLGKAETLSEGEQVRIWALGDMVHTALQTAALLETRGVSAGVVNARFVRPLDEELLLRQAASARVVATIENGIVTGGFGSGVEALLVQNGFRGRILRFGWPDRFVPQGNTATLMHEYGLTPDAIAEQIAGACRPSGV